MSRSQKNDNFIDKTFTILADLILKFLPTNINAKKAFSYYRDGMSAQSEGEYAEALANYHEALNLEDDLYDKSFILYNIGLIHASNGEYVKALEYYHKALEANNKLPQALNNIAVIYHYQAVKASEISDLETAQALFHEAAQYWKQAIKLAPSNYIEAQNWLLSTGRL
ncbi:[pt] photosystem I assembly related protein [Galdieria sulphuraria]|uniref:Photosystem I assembly protein Ycf3 n=1 Tax=Galdieria sulphuraria TaxID=130081 RepID=M2XEU9_GALSU|nr:hypothetical protein [Galdieria sulphuraria]XP_005705032.1 [pt] photosystem I assembly related protein [Galdieria sulphuraria]AIG92550.1 hypothetical protein [Galdieria sulphuraria]EME28512.1 [pt] photosystem I assembly related protein [Galdieria sulphuraria]|eukprot:XP_005705032.1 [pt] photosystem I assembly related protein [Galdieria sulphuraria]